MRYPDYLFQSHWFTHPDGLRQHYLDEGQGQPLLMLHGNPTWSYYYRHLVRALSGTHRCIVPDHIGMGLSDKPDDARYAFSLARRVDDFDALVQHLTREHALPQQGLTLVVHDWGGMIGLAWACRNPQRVARLVVLNTAAFPMPHDKRLPWLLSLGRNSRFGAYLIRHWNAFAAGATRLAVTRPLAREVAAAYVAPYDTPANRLATLRFVQDIPLNPGDRGYDLVEATGQALPQFAGRPIFMAWGLRDFVFDHTCLRTFREAWPHAEVHAFADAGHYVLEDAHERIVPSLQSFLQRTA